MEFGDRKTCYKMKKMAMSYGCSDTEQMFKNKSLVNGSYVSITTTTVTPAPAHHQHQHHPGTKEILSHNIFIRGFETKEKNFYVKWRLRGSTIIASG